MRVRFWRLSFPRGHGGILLRAPGRTVLDPSRKLEQSGEVSGLRVPEGQGWSSARRCTVVCDVRMRKESVFRGFPSTVTFERM